MVDELISLRGRVTEFFAMADDLNVLLRPSWNPCMSGSLKTRAQ